MGPTLSKTILGLGKQVILHDIQDLGPRVLQRMICKLDMD